MPVSKRAKKVSLTKVKKREPPAKRSGYVDALRTAVEKTAHVFLVEISEFARPTGFKSVRAALPPGSTLMLGKKTLMRVALGDCEENELKPGLARLAAAIRGGPPAARNFDAASARVEGSSR